MAEQLIAGPNDDAQRQELASRFFYLVGDVIAGTDNSNRYDPGMRNGSGLLGPSSYGTDVGVGGGGEVFVRGRAGQLGTTDVAQQGTIAGLPGWMVVAGVALVAWLAWRK